MVKLLIIADDFTGALDTGVKFAKAGARTAVICASMVKKESFKMDAQVLVVDAGTRHLKKEEAYRIVWNLTKLGYAWPDIRLYKKTDSALRGNIGSELTAMLDASEQSVMAFVPALPEQNRVTVHSVQLADGRPISESELGRDLFEPISCSYIPDLIKAQSDVKTVSVFRDAYEQVDFSGSDQRILIYDATGDEDMVRIAESLGRAKKLQVLAGCAAFAAVLPKVLHLDGEVSSPVMGAGKLVAICGSINPITQRQLEHGEKAGYARINLSAEMILKESFSAGDIADTVVRRLQTADVVMVDANNLGHLNEKMDYAARLGIAKEEMRTRIARRLGEIGKHVLKLGPDALMTFVGGDTLNGFLDQISWEKLTPVKEITNGCVLSLVHTGEGAFPVISKSGGLGEADWLTQLAGYMRGEGTCSKGKPQSLQVEQGALA